jgi:hypothetical protein
MFQHYDTHFIRLGPVKVRMLLAFGWQVHLYDYSSSAREPSLHYPEKFGRNCHTSFQEQRYI